MEAVRMDLPNEILNLHFSIARLQCLLEVTMRRCAEAGIAVAPADVALADEQALAYIQRKFPNRAIGLGTYDKSNLAS